MTEAEWLSCADPAPMLEFVRNEASRRKLRLFGVACRRRLFDLDGTQFTFNVPPEAQENLADDPSVEDTVNPTDDLAAEANSYADGFAWAAHFDPIGSSDVPGEHR